MKKPVTVKPKPLPSKAIGSRIPTPKEAPVPIKTSPKSK
jgi:hypothetical protein